MYEIRYTEEQLKKCGLNFLRNYAREIGGTPSLMKKDELIAYILDIQSEKIVPTRNKSGRKPLFFNGVNYSLLGMKSVEYDENGEPTLKMGEPDGKENYAVGYFETVADNMGALTDGDRVIAFVPNAYISQYRLREGDLVEGEWEIGRNNSKILTSLVSLNGKAPSEYVTRRFFDKADAIYPKTRISLSALGTSGKMADVFSPVGQGQRCVLNYKKGLDEISLMEKLAEALKSSGVHTVVSYANCRPEDGKYLERVCDEVIWTSFKNSDDEHKKAVKLAVERVKRIAETGDASALILGSVYLTEEAFGTDKEKAIRTILAAAKNTENCGSVTLIALTDDKNLAEQLEGYCNCFISLDGKALDVARSYTRRGDGMLHPRVKEVAEKIRLKSDNETIERVIGIFETSSNLDETINKLEELF